MTHFETKKEILLGALRQRAGTPAPVAIKLQVVRPAADPTNVRAILANRFHASLNSSVWQKFDVLAALEFWLRCSLAAATAIHLSRKLWLSTHLCFEMI